MIFRIKSKEEQLVDGCVAEKPKYQRQLYELYADKMLVVCLRYTKNTEEAEDVLQESFIKVFDKIGSFRKEGSLEGWIRRITVNTAIRYIQTKSPIVSKADLHIVENYEGEKDETYCYHFQDILNLVQMLPDGYKMVLNLYAIDGYSHQEIAEELNISVGTSKSQLARARKLLKTLIDKNEIQKHAVHEQSVG